MSPLRGTGAEGIFPGGPSSGWRDQVCLSVCLTDSFRPLAMLACPARKPTRSSLGAPSLRPLCFGSAWARRPLGLTPSLLRDPLFPTSAFTASWVLPVGSPPLPQPCGQAVPGAGGPSVHKPTNLPPRLHVMGWLGLRKPARSPRYYPQVAQAPEVSWLKRSWACLPALPFGGVPAARPGRGSPSPQQGKGTRSPHVTSPAPLHACLVPQAAVL